jgi:predicted small metal-binding protein
MVNYQLKCKDLGFDSCDFIATGNSESELRRKFFFHTMVLHDKDFESMEEEQKIELHNLITRILDDQN